MSSSDSEPFQCVICKQEETKEFVDHVCVECAKSIVYARDHDEAVRRKLRASVKRLQELIVDELDSLPLRCLCQNPDCNCTAYECKGHFYDEGEMQDRALRSDECFCFE
jgi:hypothetical protein